MNIEGGEVYVVEGRALGVFTVVFKKFFINSLNFILYRYPLIPTQSHMPTMLMMAWDTLWALPTCPMLRFTHP